MAFVLIGVVMLVLRLGGWVQFHEDPFWAWVIVLTPFLLAAAWWTWADASGLTKRRAMNDMEAKKAARRAQQLEAMGQAPRGSSKKRR